MRLLPIILLALCACSRPVCGERLVAERIERIYALRERVDSIWPGFGSPEYDVPLIYFTDSLCYAVNPNERFLKSYPCERIAGDGSFALYSTPLIDSLPFHMAGHVELKDSTADNWRIPFLMCSSPEITARIIPDLGGEPGWMQMVIHEYFHGFQLRHAACLDWFAKVDGDYGPMERAYREYEWFRTSVNEENRLLLGALSPGEDTRSLLAEYAALRRARYDRTSRELDASILLYENLFETLEGTARYVEYYVIPGRYDMAVDTWLYITGANYYYATGFNLLRLFDKEQVDYKSRLFVEELSLYDLLLEMLGEKQTTA